jgi:DNA-binding transcriptional LysR family regulator
VGTALAQLRAALAHEESFDPATTRAELRVGAVDAVLAAIFDSVAARVLAEAPHARLHLTGIDPQNAPALLEAGTIDLALAPAINAPVHLNVRPLFPLSFVVASRVGHPLSRRPTLADLARYPHAVVSFAGPVGTFVDEALARAGLRRHVAVVASSFLAVAAILRSSEALAILPAPFARSLEASGQARCHPLPAEMVPPRLDMKMFWSPRAADAAPVRWLREVVYEVAREHMKTLRAG